MADDTNSENGRSFVLRAAGLVGIFFLLARVLGLVREVITQSFLGTQTPAANAYALAIQFPDAIFFVIAGGALGSAFIPTFSAYFVNEDEAGGWALFSGVLNLLMVTLIVVTGLTAVFAPQFVTLFFQQKIAEQPEILPETVRLMRIMLISTIIFGFGGLITGVLHAHQHFLFPAIAPILYNLFIIIFGFLIDPPQLGLAIGAVVGSLAYLLVQLPTLIQKGVQYSFLLSLTDPGIRKVLRLMGPRVLGLSFSRLNTFVITALTGRFAILENGSFAALMVAFRVMLLPQGIIGQALGTAAFPTLSALAAKQNYEEMRKILNDSLRIIYFLGLPISIMFMLLSRPIMQILFERGEFTAVSTQFSAWGLSFFAIGLFAITALEVINRTFYALSDTWTPVIAGAIQIVGMVILSTWFSLSLFPALNLLPLGGIALGLSLSNLLEVILLWFLLRRKMGGLNGRYFLQGVWQMSIAGAGMAGIILLLQRTVLGQAPAWIDLVVNGIIGSGIYLFIIMILKVPELRQFLALIQRRLLRR
ncbi:MAG: murein biosynthesis integral membrane protein MurJ [Chloroflexota bacterium]